MTTIFEYDFAKVFATARDRQSLELVQRLVQAEVTFHESRLTQLEELNEALGARIKELG